MGTHVQEQNKERTVNEKSGSRIVAHMQQRIAVDIKDRAKRQQIGCHNDNSGGGHNDN